MENQQWLEHRLTAQERASFERDGYFFIPDALTPEQTARFGAVIDDVDARVRRERGLGAGETVNLHDTIGHDERFLELIDWSRTFPKVWDILGWNIQLFHTQMIVTPPRTGEKVPARWGWHQDNNRMNRDIVEVELQPMISLKVAYFLSDVSQPERGNFAVVPGSQQTRTLEPSENGDPNPKGTLEVLGKPGDALIFDRRLWHAGSPNWSDQTRKVLFYGYAYRWLRSKCTMDTSRVWDKCDPIRRQLLGACTSAGGYFDPQPDDVPLRAWMREHLEVVPA